MFGFYWPLSLLINIKEINISRVRRLRVFRSFVFTFNRKLPHRLAGPPYNQRDHHPGRLI